MTPYELGFAKGEEQALSDAANGIRNSRPEGYLSVFQRGYWDGYVPRSMQWMLTTKRRAPQQIAE